MTHVTAPDEIVEVIECLTDIEFITSGISLSLHKHKIEILCTFFTLD